MKFSIQGNRPVVQGPGIAGGAPRPWGRLACGAGGIVGGFEAVPVAAGIAVGTDCAVFSCCEYDAQLLKSDWSNALRDGGVAEFTELWVLELGGRIAGAEDGAPVADGPAADGAGVVLAFVADGAG